MRENGGHIDLDEFDLFVSRIRTDDEIAFAIEQIKKFRTLTEPQKVQLRAEVEARIPEGDGNDPRKPYHNWRDMPRHTFSRLFSLGTSAYRSGNELWLTSTLAQDAPLPAVPGPAVGLVAEAAEPAVQEDLQGFGGPALPQQRPPTVLQMPDEDAPEDLRTPPAPSQINDGTEAELLIGKMLTAAGWEVVYYNQRRGFGFDLWAEAAARHLLSRLKSAVVLPEASH